METTTGGDGGMEGRTINLGILMGVTGGLAQLGPEIRQGAELAVSHVNDAEGPTNVDVQFEDTGTDPNQGISGAEALVNAGYPMICGALSSGVTIQVAQNVTIPNGVVQCSPASTSPEITGLQDNDFVYRTPPIDSLQGQVLAQIAAEREGASTASTIYVNNSYGQLLSEAFSSSFSEDYDGEVLAQVPYDQGESSYTSVVQQALADDPDLLLLVAYPEGGTPILRDFYSEFGGDIPVLVTDGLQDGTLPGKVGNDLANVTGTAPLPAGPGNDFFRSEFQSTYDAEPTVSFTGYAYDAAAVLMLANAAAGENDGAAVRDQMRNVANPGGTTVTPEQLPDAIEMAAAGEEIEYQGASSAVDFDDAGDMQTVSYEYFGFTGDGLETIEEIQFSG